MESVKLAEVSSCSVVRGGLPCLLDMRHPLASLLRAHNAHLLYQISERQRVQRQARQMRNVLVRHRLGVQLAMARPLSKQGAAASACCARAAQAYDLGLNNQRPLYLRHACHCSEKKGEKKELNAIVMSWMRPVGLWLGGRNTKASLAGTMLCESSQGIEREKQ